MPLKFIMKEDAIPAYPNLQERIQHACAYPFARPACSYLFADGRMCPLDLELVEGRVPILASGSNAAPSRLAAKFPGDDGIIPVNRAVLRHFVVVFAGHFTAYGAVPATLAPYPDARTEIWITWLTPEQLEIMHRSEGVIDCREAEQRYDYVTLRNLDLSPQGLPAVTTAGAYISRRMIAPEGEPLRFAEVSARDCSFKSLPEPQILRLAHRLLQPEASFSHFMASVLRSREQRQAWFEALMPHTVERQRI